MLASPLRLGLSLAGLFLTSTLIGTSCQQRAQDCNETLTCTTGGSDTGGTGGSDTTGGTSPGGMGGMGGGQGGMAGEGSGGQGTGGMVMPCDPGAEECEGEQIVHVSPDGEDTAEGTAEAPVASLGEALVRTTAMLADGAEFPLIYLCTTAGPYEETLSLGAEHGEVGIFGGFTCDGFVSSGEQAVLMAAEPSGHRIAEASGVTLGDLQLESPNASEPGQSSVALTVVDSTGVRILRTDLIAGTGAPGEAGMGYSEAAAGGTLANDGNDACAAGAGETNPGGPGVTTACEITSVVSVGGTGGPGGGGQLPPAGVTGAPGTPDGGSAGEGENATLCSEGGPGEPGDNGTHGPVAEALGTLGDDGSYTPPVGGNGTPGAIGEGGGGGGGAAKPNSCDTGASGGSGGGGGCPGAGAEGGQGGGGSFGLIVVGSGIELVELSVVVALGGEGGVGGDGQFGGTGADGGNRGELGTSDGNNACDGGNGGNGGRGGSGAGGPGGPSIGVVYTGMAPTGLGDVLVDSPDDGAEGGAGGMFHTATGQAASGTVLDSWTP